MIYDRSLVYHCNEMDGGLVGFRQYPEYRKSKIGWLSKVPSNWESMKLKYTSEINPSKQQIDKIGKDKLVSFLPMEYIGEDGTIQLEDDRRLREVFDSYTYFEEEDIIVAKITPCFENGKGAYCINLTNKIGFGTTELHVLRPRKGYQSKYLFYITKSHPFRKIGTASMYGAAGQKRISDGFISNFKIGFPNLFQQKLIVEFLDSETKRIARLIDKQERLIELLEEKRTALISHAVTKGLDPDVEMKDSGVEWLGDIPKHWKVAQNKLLFENLDSMRIPISSEERGKMQGEYPYYGASGIIDYVDDFIFDEPLILVAEDGANLFSRSTPLAFIARGKYWVNNHAHVLRHKRDPIEYWTYTFSIIPFDPWITGAAQPKLTQDNLGSIPIPIPPNNERKQITKYLNDITSNLDRSINKIKDLNEKLKEYRTALISATVTGKIDVRDQV